jgi:hypothetical protein
MTQPLAPSSALDFLAKREQLVTLPSGLVAKLRRPSLLRLIAQAPEGAVPASFRNMLQARASNKNRAADVPLADMDEAMRFVAAAAFVQPMVVPDGDVADYERGEINADDIDPVDVQFVFAWVSNAGAATAAPVERFPTEPHAGVEPAPAQQDLRAAAKQPIVD